MNAIPFSPIAKRFAWKEFRTLRGFWIAAFVLGVLVQWFFLAAHDRPPATGWPVAMLIVALLGAAFFAVGVAATTFSMEHEDGTYAFLTSLPTRWLPIFAGKTLFALASALSLAIALIISGCLLTGGEIPDRAGVTVALGAFGFTIFEALVWGIFFSLLLRQPLLAALLAIGAVSMSLYWLTTTYVEGNLSSVSLDSYRAVLPQRAALALSLFVVDILLARRWLTNDRPPTAFMPGFTKPLSPATAARRSVAAGAISRTFDSNSNTSTRNLSHLLWQTWRGSWRLMLAATCVAGLLFVAPYFIMAGVRWESWQQWLPLTPFAIGLISTGLFASCVFAADQRDRSYRFLAEHAAWPRHVWVARLGVWLLPVLFVLGVMITIRTQTARHLASELTGIEFNSSYWLQNRHAIDYFADAMDFALWGILLGFTVGQACSLFFRRPIVAGFVAVVISLPLLVWGIAVWSWELSRLTFLLPIVFGLLTATWLRIPDWLVDRKSLRAWLKVVVPLALPLLIIAWRLPASRALSPADDRIALAQITGNMGLTSLLDKGSTPVDVSLVVRDWLAKYESTTSVADVANGERLVRLSQAVTWPSGLPDKLREDPTQAERDAYHQEFVEHNREIAKEAVQLSEKKFVFAPRFDLSQVIDDPAYNQVVHLNDLVSDTGALLTKEGKLDEALKFHLAALRIWDRLYNRAPIGLLPSSWVRRKLESRLADWANAEGQTAERIRRAIAALAAFDSPAGTSTAKRSQGDSAIAHWSPPEPLLADYLALQEIVLGKRPSNLLNRNTDIAEYAAVIANQLPFERTRALKLLDFLLVARTAQWHEVTARMGQESLQKLSKSTDNRIGDLTAIGAGQGVRRQIQLAYESHFDGDQVTSKQRDYPPYSWLWNSGLVQMELERVNSFGYWLTNVVDRQVASWGLRQQLALAAYRLEHGTYPDSIDRLVPGYLPFVPIDAYSGLPFEYRPQGLPLPLKVFGGSGSTIAAGTPLLWSIGGCNARLQAMTDVSATEDQSDDGDSMGVELAVNTFYRLEGEMFDYRYFAEPLVFPLPKPPAESAKIDTP